MRLKKIVACAAAFSILLLACLAVGCAKKDAEGEPAGNGSASIETAGKTSKKDAEDEPAGNDLTPIETVRETFDEETSKIKNTEFDNLSFSNAYFSFPDAPEMFQLEYNNEVTEFTCAPEEAYDYLCERVDELLPGMYDDEQKAEEIRFIDAGPVNREGYSSSTSSESTPLEVTPSEHTDLPKITDLRYYPDMRQYLDEDLVTEHPNPMIANKDCYIELYNGVLLGYDRGELAKQSGYADRVDKFDAIQVLPVEYRTLHLDSDRVYHLRSGDISVAEAVRLADEHLSALELSFRELPIKPKVQSVIIVRVDDSDFAFYFKIVDEYKQMMFDSFELDDSSVSMEYTSNWTNETDFPGTALMIDEGDLTRYRMISMFAYSDFKETASFDAVIPLGEATEIASDYLTDGMSFNVLSVSAVYKSFSAKDYSQYSVDENYENRKITVRPCWRFALEPADEGVTKLYYVYVDMIDGKAYTLVQQMVSDAKYD